jgi:hypothetical protein
VIDLRLSIRQTYAAIGIESNPATQQMKSPQGDLQIQQPAAKMDFSSEPAILQVDSSEAQHALGRGPNLEWNKYVNGQMQSVFLRQLADKVEAGHRMALIANPKNAFAELARDNVFKQSGINYQAAVPDFDNVKLSYEPGKVQTHIEASPVEIQYTPQKPDIQVAPGKVDIYIRQKNSIDISVTTYDLYS